MHKKRYRVLVAYWLIIGMVFSLSHVIVPTYAVPVYGQSPCPKPAYRQPFTGISSCDWVNSLCAAVASIFTWTPQDSSVDSGYDRVRDFFVSQGWTSDTIDGVHPMRLSSGFIDTHRAHSDDYVILPETIWQENIQHHQVNIAYSILVPLMEPDLAVFVTQFEYPINSVDTHNIPLPGAKPSRIRLWGIDAELAHDASGKILHLNNNNFSIPYPLGQVIWDANKRINPGKNMDFWYRYSLKTPPMGQNLTSRWSCQRIDYSRSLP